MDTYLFLWYSKHKLVRLFCWFISSIASTFLWGIHAKWNKCKMRECVNQFVVAWLLVMSIFSLTILFALSRHLKTKTSRRLNILLKPIIGNFKCKNLFRANYLRQLYYLFAKHWQAGAVSDRWMCPFFCRFCYSPNRLLIFDDFTVYMFFENESQFEQFLLQFSID